MPMPVDQLLYASKSTLFRTFTRPEAIPSAEGLAVWRPTPMFAE